MMDTYAPVLQAYQLPPLGHDGPNVGSEEEDMATGTNLSN